MPIREVKLGDICTIKGGYAFKSSEFIKSGIPVVKIANIVGREIDFNEDSSFLSPANLEQYREYVVNKGDILVALSGATTGKFGIYKLDEIALLNQRVAKIVPKNEQVCPKYLFYYMDKLQNKILQKAGGAAQPNISPKEIAQFTIPLPSIEIQNRISEILDKAQELIDKRKAQIEALDQLTQSVFLEMFGDPMLNKKQWPKKKLGNICSIVRGGSPRPIEKFLGGHIPWIKISDATKGDSIYLKNTKEFIIEEGVKKSRLIKKGSLIFANCGVSLGFARIITFDGCIHDGWLAFEDIPNYVNKIFLLKLLNQFTDYFRKTAPDGTQPNLNTTIMKNFEVILPPIELQNRFADIVLKIESQKDLLQKSLEELENNFSSLMQQAFKGELFND
ncbi:restriction endonuclease subunit S [Anoxybacillus sp. FSL W8-1294]|uniref:restriction endonuclease subunit S n=1 Tax=Anoxybacillus sp. FSL W8-1294 TaxID=2954655 RepID=UPI0030CD7A0D